MPNLLAFDTSAHVCSVALSHEGRLTVLHELMERQQANRILPMIDHLLAASNLTLSQLDAIAFSCGPGSFTGIRLAANIAQGLVYGSGLKVIPVSSCQVLAQTAHSELQASHVLVALNAHLGEVYWGMYEQNAQGLMQAVIEDQRIKPQLVQVPREIPWIGIGDGWDLYGDMLKDILKQQEIHLTQVKTVYYPHAKAIIPLAQEKWIKGEHFTAEQILPNYLYDGDLWKKAKAPIH